MKQSNLSSTLTRIANQSAEAISDYLRSNNPALNRHIRKALSTPPGHSGSLLADPMIEVAQDWASAEQTFGQMAGTLLDPRLVTALDQAKSERMPHDRAPYAHQLQAWQAAAKGHSVLVSSGTGSGKTECFMIPILNDILQNPRPGGGVQAIIVYPLNALIQSQRDRLSAWAEGLGGSVTYALYNGDTREKPDGTLAAIGETLDRKSIRIKPPSILVTNITMLEYMLLRSEDQSILQKSQGLLRWIVLDEAHSYIGAQASEMAMLLRRVRAAFGVTPDQVRLMATSATIEDDTGTRLNEFMQGLSGRGAEGITITKGSTTEAPMPKPGKDVPFDMVALLNLADDQTRWQALATHPRVQSLRTKLKSGMTMGEIAAHCFDRADARSEAERLLDLIAQARDGENGLSFLRWRGHIFLRSLGGAWACLDPACPHSAAELRDSQEWHFGQVHFTLREHCTCGAPCMEIAICGDCGAPHLKARQEFGAKHRLILPQAGVEDDYTIDVEPDPENPSNSPIDDLWVSSDKRRGRLCHLDPATLELFSTPPDSSEGLLTMQVLDGDPVCDCNETRSETRFKYARFSPAFLMGHNMQTMIESFSQPDIAPAKKPLGGRGAISFTDSRQGVARLSAKLQQEAERSLTRAFLFHEVHSSSATDTSANSQLMQMEAALAMFEANGMEAPPVMRDAVANLRRDSLAPKGIKWEAAVADLAGQPELGLLVREVWKDRSDDFEHRNDALARVLMYREMMRRPIRQNNAETMGLARLSFPRLEQAVLTQPLPAQLQGRGVTNEDYLGLVLSAVDFFFREKLIIALEVPQHLRWIAPKWGRLKQACNNDVKSDDRGDSEPFPSAKAKGKGRMNRIALNALALTGGSRDITSDLEEADVLLRQVFSVIASQACKVWTQNAVALDFSRAELLPYKEAWLCPLSRRVFAYTLKGCSPLDARQPMQRLNFVAPPIASFGGLTGEQRKILSDWVGSDPQIAGLREQGVWTGLHDRAVIYSPYMRAQEHSAQLPRSQLSDYEKQFNTGQINLLACSTTMEMGVDLSNVGLVVNSNVPPSVSNYRQRVGRAGRRREPWAFGVTWCRDLPLDRKVFEDPRRLLYARMTAPKVTLNSPILMQRHVNAATLATWLRGTGGMKVSAKAGPFFGVDADGKAQPDAPVDRFLNALAGASGISLLPEAEALLKGSCLTGTPAKELVLRVATTLKSLAETWRAEYKSLVQRSKGSVEADVSRALTLRAASMHGAFLLSDLSRAGFTPAYGFPSDVVTFDHISPSRDKGDFAIRPQKGNGGASRTLDVALREYAPGSDIVINGLVYSSEGIRPAWSTTASAGNLEDLRQLYLCEACGKPHLARALSANCECGSPINLTAAMKTLRPVGFVGRSEPHIGYEMLHSSPLRMPQISASEAEWQIVSADEGCRMRATAMGQVITLGSGENDSGYAICLVCGRAASEHASGGIGAGPVPAAMLGHKPLVSGGKETVVSNRCIGGESAQRIQRHVHLLHDRRTDVFELQLPLESTQAAAVALAAAIRESVAAWLGVEPAELGIATGPSKGAEQSRRVSAYLFDKAAGGAGLSIRLGEEGIFATLIKDVTAQLDCPEGCANGCPSCILRPDMNMSQIAADREAARDIALRLRNALLLDLRKQVFGPQSSALQMPLFDMINQAINQKTALSLTLFARGKPADWAISDWQVVAALPSWQRQVPVTIVFATEALKDPSLDIPTRLQLVRIGGDKGLANLATLPRAGLLGLVAVIETADGLRAVAAAATSESLPNDRWGKGEADLLISGSIDTLPDWSFLPVQEILPKAEAGKSVHCVMGKRLNVALPRFGKAFWKLIAEDAPALYDRLATEGVTEVRYDDRYFLKPVHFRLLREIMLSLPGATVAPVLRVFTMNKDPNAAPKTLDWNLACDEDREALFDQLFPGDRFSILPKSETRHARSLTITTNAGTTIMIYLDQGMDLWRLVTTSPISSGRNISKIALELEQSNAFLEPRFTPVPPIFVFTT